MDYFKLPYCILCLLLLASCSSLVSERKPASSPTCKENGIGCPFLNIGHRGAPLDEAENTIPAFAAAIKQGANALELDLVMTAEGEVAVFHDRDPNSLIAFIRQAGLEGQKYIPSNPGLFTKNRMTTEELTLDELRSIYGYARSKGILGDIFLNNEKDPNAYIPSLEEFSSWADTQPELEAIFLDIKLEPGQEALATHMANKFNNAFKNSDYRVYMLTPHESIYETLQKWISENPFAKNRYLTLDMEEEGALSKLNKLTKPSKIANLKNKLKKKVKSLALGSTVLRNWDNYTAELTEVLDRARRRRDMVYPVVSWTVDNERRLYQLLQMGVDGILTNRPDLLNRLVNRHWKDHSLAAKTLASCYDKSKQDKKTQICATGAQLAPLGPIGQEEIRTWACSERNVHPTLKDFYGCGGIFDKVNIRFSTKIEDNASVVMHTSAKGVEVVKLPAPLTEDDQLVFVNYNQQECNDGILNAKCEFQFQAQYYLNGKWTNIAFVSEFKDSFSHIVVMPKASKYLRLLLNETDDGQVDDRSEVTIALAGDLFYNVAGKGKVFKGQYKINPRDSSPWIKRSQEIPVALEFLQKKCNDGVLNYKCEYKLIVEAMGQDGKLIPLEEHTQPMKDSFVVYANLPKTIVGLKFTLNEMDESEISSTSQFYLDLEHGNSFGVDSGDGTFYGDITIKFLDYDEAKQGSEGDEFFVPHNQKDRIHLKLRDLRLP